MPLKNVWIQDETVYCAEVHGTRHENHGSINGTPSFNVRLEVLFSQYAIAISKLLGTPEFWPIAGLKNIRAVSVNVVTNESGGFTDVKKQVIGYDKMLLDVTYIARKGQYVYLYNQKRGYMEDTSELRNESKPEFYKNVIWGDKNSISTVPNDKIPLHPDEVPTRFEPGQNITHIIEGWVEEGAGTQEEIKNYIGTVNAHEYVSVNLNQRFAIGTLLLLSYTAEPSFSFISYDATTTQYGKPTAILKLNYAYRPNGWEKFWRNRLDGESGYYYILKNNDPWDPYVPFPLKDHRPFLGYTVIPLP